MNLGSPWMLLLLPVVVLAGWLMRRAHRLQYEAACRLQGVAPDNSPVANKTVANKTVANKTVGLVRRDYLALATFACTILALARPQWNPRPYNVERRGRDLVIALDVSRSMLAADVFPSRLETARIAIHEALPALTGQRIGLITFAGSARVRVPLTLDHGFVRYMLERADASNVDMGSTSLQAAFEMAADKVLTDAAGGRDLVVFTDGEDHLSNIEKTAELLAECGARVLIVGLGDPIQGARVPSVSDAGKWMRYKGVEVVSRLEEETLATLAGKSPNVTYYPARKRPFELLPLYQELISGATDDVVVGQLRQVRYTEGYPYLLGLSVALWLMSSPVRLRAARHLVLLALLVLLLPGCARPVEEGEDAAFRDRFQRGNELLQYAQEQSGAEPAAQRSILCDAREQFLRAALLRRGDLDTARRITAITRHLKQLEVVIEKQRVEEEKRDEKLAEIIQRLQTATSRQQQLAQQSQQILVRYPPPPPSQQTLLRYSAPIMRELTRLAKPTSAQQRSVRQETVSIRNSIASQRDTLREILTRAYGNIGRLPATELDPVADLLEGALIAQQQALDNLTPQSVRWPQANTAFHTAAGRLQQAFETLRSLQPPARDKKDNAMPSANDGEYEENLDTTDSGAQGNKSQPLSGRDFKETIALPEPNYTSADILAEELANQQQRARRKAARAGAKVEKNW